MEAIETKAIVARTCPDEHARLKAAAALRGVTLQETVLRLLRAELLPMGREMTNNDSPRPNHSAA